MTALGLSGEADRHRGRSATGPAAAGRRLWRRQTSTRKRSRSGWEATRRRRLTGQIELARDARRQCGPRGRGGDLPFVVATFDAAVSMFTHTDVDGLRAVDVVEIARDLRRACRSSIAEPSVLRRPTRLRATAEDVPELHPGYLRHRAPGKRALGDPRARAVARHLRSRRCLRRCPRRAGFVTLSCEPERRNPHGALYDRGDERRGRALGRPARRARSSRTSARSRRATRAPRRCRTACTRACARRSPRGIDELYAHQARGVGAAARGEHVDRHDRHRRAARRSRSTCPCSTRSRASRSSARSTSTRRRRWRRTRPARCGLRLPEAARRRSTTATRRPSAAGRSASGRT